MCCLQPNPLEVAAKLQLYYCIIVNHFNVILQEEDFDKLEQYDDYLEEIERIIYNLCNNIDIVNTNKRIEQYKRENREIIMKNKSRMGRAEYELELMLESEKSEDQRRVERETLEQTTKKKHIKEKEALIDELMHSYDSASDILKGYTENVEKLQEEAKALPVPKSQTEFSTGVKFGHQSMFQPIPKYEEGPLFVYQEPIIFIDGPTPPDLIELECKGKRVWRVFSWSFQFLLWQI